MKYYTPFLKHLCKFKKHAQNFQIYFTFHREKFDDINVDESTSKYYIYSYYVLVFSQKFYIFKWVI